MKPLFSRWDKIFARLVAIGFLFAACWGSLLDPNENPIPGLQIFSKNLLAAWPSAVFGLYVAVVVSFTRLQSVSRLFFLSGFSACAWFVLATFLSPGGSIGLAFLAGILYSAAKKRLE